MLTDFEIFILRRSRQKITDLQIKPSYNKFGQENFQRDLLSNTAFILTKVLREHWSICPAKLYVHLELKEEKLN